ncbi:MAG: phosphoribosylanthranilate isomerase [Bacteroidales bacterium]|nr:phosphoribosylanthranilate isomerase [Bacteroidales bacterium]
MTRIKICCIGSVSEARMAIRHGANALGLVGKMPSGPGVIPDETIAGIARVIPPGLSSFLLTSETNAEAVIAHHRRTHTNTIQLVDTLSFGEYPLLKEEMPAIRIVQVIHVLNEQSVEDALLMTQHVDALLLDSGNPFLAIKELGGTGRVHNWLLSKEIVKQSPIPVFLAGGLNPANVREAIDIVQPFGVDVCSGVRTNGMLDEFKLEAFIKAAGL